MSSFISCGLGVMGGKNGLIVMHHHLEVHCIGLFVDEEVAVGDVETD